VAPTPGSSDVTLSRLSLLRNQRQGMSVIGALHLLVEDSLFADTNGSEPMAGVDLEPNHATDALHNVTFRRCVARANGGGGFQMYLGRFQHGTALPLSVRFEDCRVEGAGVCTLQPDSPGCPGFGFYLLPPMARAEPPGSPAVLLQNCSVQKTVQPALVFGGVSTPGASVAVRGGVFEAPLRASPAVSPVQIVGGAAWSGTVGGISFEEPVIRYGAGAVAAPWLRAQSAPAVANVSGRVRVETGGLPTAVCTPKLQPAVANITVKAECISRRKSDDAAPLDLTGSSSREKTNDAAAARLPAEGIRPTITVQPWCANSFRITSGEEVLDGQRRAAGCTFRRDMVELLGARRDGGWRRVEGGGGAARDDTGLLPRAPPSLAGRARVVNSSGL